MIHHQAQNTLLINAMLNVYSKPLGDIYKQGTHLMVSRRPVNEFSMLKHGAFCLALSSAPACTV